MGKLDGKTALITGANSGIGFTSARRFIAEGARVTITGRRADAVEKAALRSFTRTLAAELAPRGIRVNALSPGPIETPIFGKIGLEQKEIDEFQKNMSALVPLGRFGTADEIAAVAVFLASGDSSYITGSEITADGGMSQV